MLPKPPPSPGAPRTLPPWDSRSALLIATDLPLAAKLPNSGTAGAFHFRSSPGSLAILARNPPRLVAREQIGGRAPAGLVLAIHEGECLPVVVADDEARRGLFDGPWQEDWAGYLL